MIWRTLGPVSQSGFRGTARIAMTSLPIDCWIIVSLITICVVSSCGAFNLDTDKTILHFHADADSKFGFTVAQYADQNGPWLLVGAPEANTGQPGVHRPGGVYKCRSLNNTQCQLLPFDTDGHDQYLSPADGQTYTVSNKTLQWFGASLSSSSGYIAACAPRYVYFTRKLDKREPIGACFVMENERTAPKKYYPCKSEDHRYSQGNEQTSCQAGLAMETQEDKLVIGAVGSFYWQGQVVLQDIEDQYNVQETAEAPKQYDNSNRGYSVTVGDFNGDGDEDIATSAPRSNDSNGIVELFTSALTSFANITGAGQIGEFFGLSLASGDFNGDGRDDLVVGAPLYMEEVSRTYEMGRVYVYYQTQDSMEPLRAYQILSGRKDRGGRFGYAVSSTGDLNDDGFTDLAVGAPYGGEMGYGAVYIFQGSSQGVKSAYSQIIQASALGSNLRTMGFSLSGGMDMDNNYYPDLLVGAQESAQAVLFRARPVVQVAPLFSTNIDSVNLEKKDCSLNGRQHTCYELTTCLTYGGKGTKDRLYFQVEWVLDYEKRLKETRVYLHDNTGRHRTTEMELSVLKTDQTCHTLTVYLKDEIRDKLRPIWTQLNIKLVQDLTPTAIVNPILDIYRPKTYLTSIDIKKICGDDEICIPDLKLDIYSSQKEFVYGTSSEIELMVSVENLGEGSYETMLYINMPPGITYINVNEELGKQEVVCTSLTHEGSDEETVVCDVANPLPSQQTVKFSVRVHPQNVGHNLTSLVFDATVNSTNPENTTTFDDNAVSVEMTLTAEVDLRIQGVSVPGQLLFNASVESEYIVNISDVGPVFTHRYVITNRGPSSLSEMVTDLYWPELLYDGSLIFYLTEVPAVVEGDGYCEADIIPLENVTKMAHKSGKEDGVLETFLMSMFGGQAEEEDTIFKVGCSTERQWPYCKKIQCTTGNMEQSDNIVIEVKGRAFVQTMVEVIKSFRGVNATSFARATVTSFPYSINSAVNPQISYQVETFVTTLDAGAGTEPLQWWIITLAIVGGVLLLLLMVFLLWKFGFFKRNKFDDEKKLTDEDEDTGEHVSSNGNKGTPSPKVHVDGESRELYKAIPDHDY